MANKYISSSSSLPPSFLIKIEQFAAADFGTREEDSPPVKLLITHLLPSPNPLPSLLLLLSSTVTQPPTLSCSQSTGLPYQPALLTIALPPLYHHHHCSPRAQTHRYSSHSCMKRAVIMPSSFDSHYPATAKSSRGNRSLTVFVFLILFLVLGIPSDSCGGDDACTEGRDQTRSRFSSAMPSPLRVSIAHLPLRFARADDCATGPVASRNRVIANTIKLHLEQNSTADQCDIGGTVTWTIDGSQLDTIANADGVQTAVVRAWVLRSTIRLISRVRVYGLAPATPQNILGGAPAMLVTIHNNQFTDSVFTIEGAIPVNSIISLYGNTFAYSSLAGDLTLPWSLLYTPRCTMLVGIGLTLYPRARLLMDSNAVVVTGGNEAFGIAMAGPVTLYEGSQWLMVRNNITTESDGGRSQPLYAFSSSGVYPSAAPSLSFAKSTLVNPPRDSYGNMIGGLFAFSENKVVITGTCTLLCLTSADEGQVVSFENVNLLWTASSNGRFEVSANRMTVTTVNTNVIGVVVAGVFAESNAGAVFAVTKNVFNFWSSSSSTSGRLVALAMSGAGSHSGLYTENTFHFAFNDNSLTTRHDANANLFSAVLIKAALQTTSSFSVSGNRFFNYNRNVFPKDGYVVVTGAMTIGGTPSHKRVMLHSNYVATTVQPTTPLLSVASFVWSTPRSAVWMCFNRFNPSGGSPEPFGLFINNLMSVGGAAASGGIVRVCRLTDTETVTISFSQRVTESRSQPLTATKTVMDSRSSSPSPSSSMLVSGGSATMTKSQMDTETRTSVFTLTQSQTLPSTVSKGSDSRSSSASAPTSKTVSETSSLEPKHTLTPSSTLQCTLSKSAAVTETATIAASPSDSPSRSAEPTANTPTLSNTYPNSHSTSILQTLTPTKKISTSTSVEKIPTQSVSLTLEATPSRARSTSLDRVRSESPLRSLSRSWPPSASPTCTESTSYSSTAKGLWGEDGRRSYSATHQRTGTVDVRTSTISETPSGVPTLSNSGLPSISRSGLPTLSNSSLSTLSSSGKGDDGTSRSNTHNKGDEDSRSASKSRTPARKLHTVAVDYVAPALPVIPLQHECPTASLRFYERVLTTAAATENEVRVDVDGLTNNESVPSSSESESTVSTPHIWPSDRLVPPLEVTDALVRSGGFVVVVRLDDNVAASFVKPRIIVSVANSFSGRDPRTLPAILDTNGIVCTLGPLENTRIRVNQTSSFAAFGVGDDDTESAAETTTPLLFYENGTTDATNPPTSAATAAGYSYYDASGNFINGAPTAAGGGIDSEGYYYTLYSAVREMACTLPQSPLYYLTGPEAIRVTIPTDATSLICMNDKWSAGVFPIQPATTAGVTYALQATITAALAITTSILMLIGDGTAIEIQALILGLASAVASSADIEAIRYVKYFMSPFIDMGPEWMVGGNIMIVLVFSILHFVIYFSVRSGHIEKAKREALGLIQKERERRQLLALERCRAGGAAIGGGTYLFSEANSGGTTAAELNEFGGLDGSASPLGLMHFSAAAVSLRPRESQYHHRVGTADGSLRPHRRGSIIGGAGGGLLSPHRDAAQQSSEQLHQRRRPHSSPAFNGGNQSRSVGFGTHRKSVAMIAGGGSPRMLVPEIFLRGGPILPSQQDENGGEDDGRLSPARSGKACGRPTAATVAAAAAAAGPPSDFEDPLSLPSNSQPSSLNNTGTNQHIGKFIAASSSRPGSARPLSRGGNTTRSFAGVFAVPRHSVVNLLIQHSNNHNSNNMAISRPASAASVSNGGLGASRPVSRSGGHVGGGSSALSGTGTDSSANKYHSYQYLRGSGGGAVGGGASVRPIGCVSGSSSNMATSTSISPRSTSNTTRAKGGLGIGVVGGRGTANRRTNVVFGDDQNASTTFLSMKMKSQQQRSPSTFATTSISNQVFSGNNSFAMATAAGGREASTTPDDQQQQPATHIRSSTPGKNNNSNLLSLLLSTSLSTVGGANGLALVPSPRGRIGMGGALSPLPESNIPPAAVSLSSRPPTAPRPTKGAALAAVGSSSSPPPSVTAAGAPVPPPAASAFFDDDATRQEVLCDEDEDGGRMTTVHGDEKDHHLLMRGEGGRANPGPQGRARLLKGYHDETGAASPDGAEGGGEGVDPTFGGNEVTGGGGYLSISSPLDTTRVTTPPPAGIQRRVAATPSSPRRIVVPSSTAANRRQSTYDSPRYEQLYPHHQRESVYSLNGGGGGRSSPRQRWRALSADAPLSPLVVLLTGGATSTTNNPNALPSTTSTLGGCGFSHQHRQHRASSSRRQTEDRRRSSSLKERGGGPRLARSEHLRLASDDLGQSNGYFCGGGGGGKNGAGGGGAFLLDVMRRSSSDPSGDGNGKGGGGGSSTKYLFKPEGFIGSGSSSNNTMFNNNPHNDSSSFNEKVRGRMAAKANGLERGRLHPDGHRSVSTIRSNNNNEDNSTTTLSLQSPAQSISAVDAASPRNPSTTSKKHGGGGGGARSPRKASCSSSKKKESTSRSQRQKNGKGAKGNKSQKTSFGRRGAAVYGEFDDDDDDEGDLSIHTDDEEDSGNDDAIMADDVKNKASSGGGFSMSNLAKMTAQRQWKGKRSARNGPEEDDDDDEGSLCLSGSGGGYDGEEELRRSGKEGRHSLNNKSVNSRGSGRVGFHKNFEGRTNNKSTHGNREYDDSEGSFTDNDGYDEEHDISAYFGAALFGKGASWTGADVILPQQRQRGDGKGKDVKASQSDRGPPHRASANGGISILSGGQYKITLPAHCLAIIARASAAYCLFPSLSLVIATTLYTGVAAATTQMILELIENYNNSAMNNGGSSTSSSSTYASSSSSSSDASSSSASSFTTLDGMMLIKGAVSSTITATKNAYLLTAAYPYFTARTVYGEDGVLSTREYAVKVALVVVGCLYLLLVPLLFLLIILNTRGAYFRFYEWGQEFMIIIQKGASPSSRALSSSIVTTANVIRRRSEHFSPRKYFTASTANSGHNNSSKSSKLATSAATHSTSVMSSSNSPRPQQQHQYNLLSFTSSMGQSMSLWQPLRQRRRAGGGGGGGHANNQEQQQLQTQINKSCASELPSSSIGAASQISRVSGGGGRNAGETFDRATTEVYFLHRADRLLSPWISKLGRMPTGIHIRADSTLLVMLIPKGQWFPKQITHSLGAVIGGCLPALEMWVLIPFVFSLLYTFAFVIGPLWRQPQSIHVMAIMISCLAAVLVSMTRPFRATFQTVLTVLAFFSLAMVSVAQLLILNNGGVAVSDLFDDSGNGGTGGDSFFSTTKSFVGGGEYVYSRSANMLLRMSTDGEDETTTTSTYNIERVAASLAPTWPIQLKIAFIFITVALVFLRLFHTLMMLFIDRRVQAFGKAQAAAAEALRNENSVPFHDDDAKSYCEILSESERTFVSWIVDPLAECFSRVCCLCCVPATHNGTAEDDDDDDLKSRRRYAVIGPNGAEVYDDDDFDDDEGELDDEVSEGDCREGASLDEEGEENSEEAEEYEEGDGDAGEYSNSQEGGEYSDANEDGFDGRVFGQTAAVAAHGDPLDGDEPSPSASHQRLFGGRRGGSLTEAYQSSHPNTGIDASLQCSAHLRNPYLASTSPRGGRRERQSKGRHATNNAVHVDGGVEDVSSPRLGQTNTQAQDGDVREEGGSDNANTPRTRQKKKACPMSRKACGAAEDAPASSSSQRCKNSSITHLPSPPLAAAAPSHSLSTSSPPLCSCAPYEAFQQHRLAAQQQKAELNRHAELLRQHVLRSRGGGGGGGSAETVGSEGKKDERPAVALSVGPIGKAAAAATFNGCSVSPRGGQSVVDASVAPPTASSLVDSKHRRRSSYMDPKMMDTTSLVTSSISSPLSPAAQRRRGLKRTAASATADEFAPAVQQQTLPPQHSEADRHQRSSLFARGDDQQQGHRRQRDDGEHADDGYGAEGEEDGHCRKASTVSSPRGSVVSQIYSHTPTSASSHRSPSVLSGLLSTAASGVGAPMVVSVIPTNGGGACFGDDDCGDPLSDTPNMDNDGSRGIRDGDEEEGPLGPLRRSGSPRASVPSSPASYSANTANAVAAFHASQSFRPHPRSRLHQFVPPALCAGGGGGGVYHPNANRQSMSAMLMMSNGNASGGGAPYLLSPMMRPPTPSHIGGGGAWMVGSNGELLPASHLCSEAQFPMNAFVLPYSSATAGAGVHSAGDVNANPSSSASPPPFTNELDCQFYNQHMNHGGEANGLGGGVSPRQRCLVGTPRTAHRNSHPLLPAAGEHEQQRQMAPTISPRRLRTPPQQLNSSRLASVGGGASGSVLHHHSESTPPRHGRRSKSTAAGEADVATRVADGLERDAPVVASYSMETAVVLNDGASSPVSSTDVNERHTNGASVAGDSGLLLSPPLSPHCDQRVSSPIGLPPRPPSQLGRAGSSNSIRQLQLHRQLLGSGTAGAAAVAGNPSLSTSNYSNRSVGSVLSEGPVGSSPRSILMKGSNYNSTNIDAGKGDGPLHTGSKGEQKTHQQPFTQPPPLFLVPHSTASALANSGRSVEDSSSSPASIDQRQNNNHQNLLLSPLGIDTHPPSHAHASSFQQSQQQDRAQWETRENKEEALNESGEVRCQQKVPLPHRGNSSSFEASLALEEVLGATRRQHNNTTCSSPSEQASPNDVNHQHSHERLRCDGIANTAGAAPIVNAGVTAPTHVRGSTLRTAAPARKDSTFTKKPK